MRFYVRANNNYIKCPTEKEAEELALILYGFDKIKYVEYGVVNYDGWRGMSPLVAMCKK